MSRSMGRAEGRNSPTTIIFFVVAVVVAAAVVTMAAGCGSSPSEESSESVTTQSTSIGLTTLVTEASGADEQGSGATVVVKNGVLDPTELVVPVGTAVTFEDMDDDTTRTYHFVSKDGSFDTGVLGQGGSYTITFQKAETIDYYDKGDPSITGRVIIQ